jgi:uncharacterized protein
MVGRCGILILLMAGIVSGARAQDAPPQGPAPGEGPDAAATPAATPESAPDCSARPLDSSERDTLLRLAWRTLAGHLTGNPIKDADLEGYSFTPCLTAARGLFVTLKKAGRVRGMQGDIEPSRPLYQQVIVFTRRAATRDPRFLPLTDVDLGETIIELDLIGARTRISGPADMRIDDQGVFLEKWGRRALFLPALLAGKGWSSEKTLDELCAQAALPRGSWSESARIEMFKTEVVAGPQPARLPPTPPLPEGSAPSPTPGVPGVPGRTGS